MQYIVHGDDVVASRKKMQDLARASEWVIHLNAGKHTSHDVQEALERQELFTQKKVVIIEDFASSGKSFLEQLSIILKKAPQETVDVILWEGNTIPKKIIDTFEHTQVFAYTLPKYYYAFLDSLVPHATTKACKLLSRVYPVVSSELIFYSLIKRIRLLLMLKSDAVRTLEETRKLPSWQIQKLTQQARAWKEEELIEFYKNLFKLELGLKTSALPLPLIAHIEILFIQTL